MKYEELVKALRWCSVDEYVPCTGCPMNEETHGTGCFNIMHQRAADAIEELQAQLPKRGKWKVDMSHFSPHIVCSVCGVEIPCVAGWCMDAHMNYCPNCGAKMGGTDEQRT